MLWDIRVGRVQELTKTHHGHQRAGRREERARAPGRAGRFLSGSLVGARGFLGQKRRRRLGLDPFHRLTLVGILARPNVDAVPGDSPPALAPRVARRGLSLGLGVRRSGGRGNNKQ